MSAKYWELIADSLHRAGCSWGMVKVAHKDGRAWWTLDARMGDGPRHVVHTDDLLSGFLELEASVKTASAAD